LAWRGLAIVVVGVAFGHVLGRGQQEEEPAMPVEAPRAVILKNQRALHLFDGEALVRTYAIDLGTAPVGQKRRKGDGRTPTGRFRVVTKNATSTYHRFIGIDYPNEEAVGWGLGQGLISPGEAVAIRDALAAGRCPDWGTALGGGIGIHGRGKGHDWTAGCVALSDPHVEELFSILRIGDPVEILP
jgi:murein L,D-transpeptidase YafK